ncbi:PQQ-dependent sugar dehydrogenase [Thalassobius sp. MITS945101]|uniref:PQQ-dependent sugar dehydrogenase n=1 Tax=Thalassobius sp. MITS945101 TaxID=3096994 RepID=UPI00399A98BA
MQKMSVTCWFNRLLAPALAFMLTLGHLTTAAEAQEYRIDRIADGFDVPWSLALLPDESLLITERPGRLWHVAQDGSRQRISGLPEIVAEGQGGLLDVVAARDFSRSRTIYFSYVTKVPGGLGTALAAAQIDLDGHRLEQLRVLFKMPKGNNNARHFGGRIVEGRGGYVFLTIGDMGDRRQAQNTASYFGKILRLHLDGTAPRDNPFHGFRNARREIWSIGHRNPQGATLGNGDTLWTSEHGPRGGDEVNLIKRGANYGWPVISYGTHYNGRKVGEGTEKRGMEQPKIYWDPSIAPSGIVYYTGRMFPEWQGDLFVGSLKFDHIAHVSGDTFRIKQRIEGPETGRVRDVRQANDGALWFLSEDKGAVFRLWR